MAWITLAVLGPERGLRWVPASDDRQGDLRVEGLEHHFGERPAPFWLAALKNPASAYFQIADVRLKEIPGRRIQQTFPKPDAGVRNGVAHQHHGTRPHCRPGIRRQSGVGDVHQHVIQRNAEQLGGDLCQSRGQPLPHFRGAHIDV